MRLDVDRFQQVDLMSFPDRVLTEAACGRPRELWMGDMLHAEKAGECYTIHREGRIMCCCGVVPVWEGRALAWAVLDRRASHMRSLLLFLTREIQDFIESIQSMSRQYRRIETTVISGFAAGDKWARMLGFQCEGILRAYDPFGRDHRLYSRLKEPTHGSDSPRTPVHRSRDR